MPGTCIKNDCECSFGFFKGKFTVFIHNTFDKHCAFVIFYPYFYTFCRRTIGKTAFTGNGAVFIIPAQQKRAMCKQYPCCCNEYADKKYCMLFHFAAPCRNLRQVFSTRAAISASVLSAGIHVGFPSTLSISPGFIPYHACMCKGLP